MRSKLMLFIATEKGECVLKSLLSFDKDLVKIVIGFNEVNVKENYYNEIKDRCQNNEILFYDWNDVKSNLECLLINEDISEAVAIGWKFFIPLSINKYLKHKLIVFHDSLLPQYRGFAPTPTALICGEKEIGMSVIYAEKEADCGDIIIQKKFCVDEKIYIKDVIKKQSELYCEAMLELITKLENDNIITYKQNSNNATYSIWRNPEDCEIDWNDSSEKIYNLIRAVNIPYTGAFTYFENERIYIWKAEPVDDLNFAIRNSGKIWKIDNGMPLIVCGEGILKLTDITDENGNDFIFNKLRIRLGRRW